jgi:hypothetical protein
MVILLSCVVLFSVLKCLCSVGVACVLIRFSSNFARAIDRWIGVTVFAAQLGSFIYWNVILVQLTRKWSYSR